MLSTSFIVLQLELQQAYLFNIVNAPQSLLQKFGVVDFRHYNNTQYIWQNMQFQLRLKLAW